MLTTLTADTVLIVPPGEIMVVYPGQKDVSCPECFRATLVVMGEIVMVVDQVTFEMFQYKQNEWAKRMKAKFLAGGGVATEDLTMPESREMVRYLTGPENSIIFTREELAGILAGDDWKLMTVSQSRPR